MTTDNTSTVDKKALTPYQPGSTDSLFDWTDVGIFRHIRPDLKNTRNMPGCATLHGTPSFRPRYARIVAAAHTVLGLESDWHGLGALVAFVFYIFWRVFPFFLICWLVWRFGK